MNMIRVLLCVLTLAAATALAQQAQERPADVPTLAPSGPLTATAESTKEMLAGIKAPAGFRVDIFAAPPEVNYPTCVTAALTGDRSHQVEFRRALRERAELTTARMNAIPGISCVMPKSAFYAMPKVDLPPGKTDMDFVLGLLRSKGVLTVYGSGFATALADGFFRIVFLASPQELGAIYDDVADFTAEFRSA